MRRFWEALRARHYAGLDLVDFVVVPNEIHTSVALESLQHALRKLYARPSVSLPVEELRRYVGKWEADDEPAWDIRLDGGRLFVEIPAYSKGPLELMVQQQRELLAESDTSFFTELGDIRVVFQFDPDKRVATEMRVTIPRHGYAGVLRRLPATSDTGTPNR